MGRTGRQELNDGARAGARLPLPTQVVRLESDFTAFLSIAATDRSHGSGTRRRLMRIVALSGRRITYYKQLFMRRNINFYGKTLDIFNHGLISRLKYRILDCILFLCWGFGGAFE
jgi:hypothetical protein